MSVIPEDSMIVVDGVGRVASFTALENAHAISWDEDRGFIQFLNPSGIEWFDDPSVMIPFIVAWEAAAPAAPLEE